MITFCFRVVPCNTDFPLYINATYKGIVRIKYLDYFSKKKMNVRQLTKL